MKERYNDGNVFGTIKSEVYTHLSICTENIGTPSLTRIWSSIKLYQRERTYLNLKKKGAKDIIQLWTSHFLQCFHNRPRNIIVSILSQY